MSIYYALAGWSGNRERRDERTKRKREKDKSIIHYSLVYTTVAPASVAQQNPYLLQARRKELRSNKLYRNIVRVDSGHADVLRANRKRRRDQNLSNDACASALGRVREVNEIGRSRIFVIKKSILVDGRRPRFNKNNPYPMAASLDRQLKLFKSMTKAKTRQSRPNYVKLKESYVFLIILVLARRDGPSGVARAWSADRPRSSPW
ncbi:hypothetical protein EVAR_75299_1 [Eumeta japonica]|uniref:Uncharacterized protein n=1 Tax=Eumeta variegata TaxID=151549 RepID=A0A4C1YZV5_EUMVA|nr:hypothetical protein EVAR_75299_1 [Eumeta japonica]